MAELGEANIGGRMVPAWLLDLTAEELDSLKSRWYNNPNLLDNWYFANPVNQRGQTEYTAVGYTIDRWSGGVTLSLKNGFIRVTSSGIYSQIFQTLESEFAGKTFTFSLIIRGTPGAQCRTLAYDYEKGVAYGMETTHEFVSDGFEMLTVSDTFPSNTPAKLTFIFYPANADTTLSVDLLAAKLELGSQQTLAHQGADGNWVLNEIPDYGEQLRRCQRYFVNFNPYKMEWFAMPPAVASNAVQAYSAVTLPVAMRAQPVASYGGNIFLSQGGDFAIKSILVSDNTFTGNYVQLRYETDGGLTANSLYRVQGGNDKSSYICLSADL